MTAPGRSVSYLPGRWTALVTDEFCLLGDVHLADPLLAECWAAGGAGAATPGASVHQSAGGSVDAVLAALARAGQQHPPNFVLVARADDALRVVVAGRAHAEVFAGQQDPAVLSTTDGQTWLDERLDGGLDVRLVADDPTPFERISPLPLTSGIVLASYVFSTAIAPVSASPGPAAPAAPSAPQDEAVGWIPPPLAQPSQEYPVRQDWPDEPAPQLSGVFRALPWRTSMVEPDEAQGVPASPVPDPSADDPAFADAPLADRPGGQDAAPPADSGAGSEPPPIPESARPAPPAAADPSQKPSFGAPGYVPPPFGAEAFDGAAFAAEGYAYPPPPPFDPVGQALPDHSDSSTPSAPLVQAVLCANGHLNPLHIEACRVCGAAFAPQQPVTVERPSLGVLQLPTGDVVVLDRDAVLGRAPFAVDQRSIRLVAVPSPANDISRSHVRITLDGWQVFATDLGSTNGTAVTLPGQPAALLRAHDPFALAPGAVLSLADEADVRFDVS